MTQHDIAAILVTDVRSHAVTQSPLSRGIFSRSFCYREIQKKKGGKKDRAPRGGMKHFQGVAGLFSLCYQRECAIRSFQPLVERFTIKRVTDALSDALFVSCSQHAGCISDNVVSCRGGFSTQRGGKRKREEREERNRGRKNWGKVFQRTSPLIYTFEVRTFFLFLFFFPRRN